MKYYRSRFSHINLWADIIQNYDEQLCCYQYHTNNVYFFKGNKYHSTKFAAQNEIGYGLSKFSVFRYYLDNKEILKIKNKYEWRKYCKLLMFQ